MQIRNTLMAAALTLAITWGLYGRKAIIVKQAHRLETGKLN